MRNRAGRTVFYTAARHRPVAGRQRPTGEKGCGKSGSVTRASLHSFPATIYICIALSQLIAKMAKNGPCNVQIQIQIQKDCERLERPKWSPVSAESIEEFKNRPSTHDRKCSDWVFLFVF